MRRRGLLVAIGSLAAAGCLDGDRTPTPSPTPPDYVDRFETGLRLDDVDPLELSADDHGATLVYEVAEPTDARVRATIRDVATAYAQTVGSGWPVDRLRVTVRFDGRPIVRYRIETAWADAFNSGGTGTEYGEKIETTVERVNATRTDER